VAIASAHEAMDDILLQHIAAYDGAAKCSLLSCQGGRSMMWLWSSQALPSLQLHQLTGVYVYHMGTSVTAVTSVCPAAAAAADVICAVLLSMPAAVLLEE
jgi:hypothetical protein